MLLTKPKALYQRLINDTIRTIADDEARRQVQFRWIIKFLTLFAVIGAVILLPTGKWILSLMMLVVALFFFLDYWIVYFGKDRGFKIATIILLLKLLAFFTFLTVQAPDGLAAAWVLVLPAISIILAGTRIAAIYNAVVLLEMLFLFWTPPGIRLIHDSYTGAFRTQLPLLYMLLFVISLFTEMLRKTTVQALRESRKRMDAVYQQQYSQLHFRIQDARRARHDMRHHFVMIDHFLSDGKYEDLREYIHKYHDSLPYEEALMFCPHYGTNALLTYCAQRSKMEDILKEIRVNFPETLPFPDEDLTVAFGNLLENALEASIAAREKTPGFVPHIWVNGQFDGQMLYFSVRNRTNIRALTDDHGSYQSSKHEGNGIGIASVQGIAEKYDGRLTINQTDDEFCAEFYIKGMTS